MTTKKRYSLIATVGGSMMIVAILALILAGVLNFLRFDETYMRLVAQRLEVTAQAVGRAVALGLDLGLPIESQDNLPGTLRQHLAADPDLRNVTVHGCDGRTVIAVERGAAAPEPWRKHLGEASWFAVEADGMSVGLGIVGPLGICGAGVSITRSAEAYLDAVNAVRHRFLWGGMAAAGAAGFAIAVAAWVFGRRRRALGAVDDDFARLLDGKAGELPASLSAEDATEGWERELVAAYLAARPAIAAGPREGGAS